MGAYGTMKAQGKTVYPIQKIEAGKERIKNLLEHNKTLLDTCGAIENISVDELNTIIIKAKELSVDGFTQAEAQELGIMIVEAVREK